MRSPLLLIAIALLAGCVSEPEEREFVIAVDSVRAPGAVSGGAAFDVAFFGTIGTSGCYAFKEFRVTKSTTAADITLIGVYRSKTGTCTDVLMLLGGRQFTISPPVADPFELRVHQPDNSLLVKTVRAE
jgi:hypothetical protein